MTDTKVETPAPPAAPVAFELTVEEFCTRKSATDRRVEMLGGFYASERAASHFKDSEQNFEGRYAAFAHLPAK